MLNSSFKTNVEINSQAQSFFRQQFTLQNYADVLEKFNFLRYFINSLIYALLITVITVYTSSMAGFVLNKYKFKGRDVLFTGILLTMMVPSVVTIIPRYSIMQFLGWIDTYKALIVPSIFSTFGIFMIRQACFSIPDEMLEAARVDGANEFYLFHKIVIPQLSNSIISIAIFQFLWAWDDYLWPYLMIRTGEKSMLAVALNLFNGRYSTDYAGLFAATSIAIIPVVIFYIIFQRHFIEGISSSSLKG
jgi:multiple sugar transport system permease protein/raffinose/stachyose/melibiose transport system permease protein